LNSASLTSIAAIVFAGAAFAPRAIEAQTFHVVETNVGGDGGTDYLTAEAGTGRVFVSRATHVMVIDGPSGKVLGDIPDTPRTHGIALAAKFGHGFTTNAGDSTVTMFDLKSLAVVRKITRSPEISWVRRSSRTTRPRVRRAMAADSST